MSLFLRTTALMLLVLSRAPAFAALPITLRLMANKIVQPAKTKFVRNFLNTALAVYMAFSQSTPHQLSHILTSTSFTAKLTKHNLNLKLSVRVPHFLMTLSHTSQA